MAIVGRRRKSNLNLPQRVYISHGAYYYAHKNGKWEKLAKVGEESEMRRRWALLEDPVGITSNVAAMIDDYLVNYAKANKADRTYKDNCSEAEYLKAFFGDMRPQDVLPKHVGQYLEEGLSASRAIRANREKALLSHVFTWSMRHPVWGSLVTSNPCRGVKRNKETKRVRIVEDYEFMAVYNKAPHSVRQLMTLIYRTLQRPSDILKFGPRNVIYRDIDGERKKVLKLSQNKTDNPMEIIFTPDLEEATANQGNVIYQTFIHTVKGKEGVTKPGSQYTYSGINSIFRRVLDDWREEVEAETGVKPKPFGLYDIKGKGATDMYLNGEPLERIQLLCGHDSITTTEIYVKSRIVKPVMPNSRKISG